MSSDLKWTRYVNAMYSKVASRLHFLKQLARSGASREDLLCFYTTAVRPVLEYACPVWHSSLTAADSDALESLQKRAMRIIHPQLDYNTALCHDDIGPLKSRRETLTEKFFLNNVLNSNSCLHYLLPEPCDPNIINRLRHPKQYEPMPSRTEKFRKSFLPYCLCKFQ